MYFENYIKGQDNWTFVAGYVDEGISGTSVNKRDNFLNMSNDPNTAKLKIILTKQKSRYARNTYDTIK